MRDEHDVRSEAVNEHTKTDDQRNREPLPRRPQWRVDHDLGYQLRADMLGGAVDLLMAVDQIVSDCEDQDEVIRAIDAVYARADAGPLERLLALGAVQAAALMPIPEAESSADDEAEDTDVEDLQPLPECLLDRSYEYLVSLHSLERAEAQVPYLRKLEVGATIPVDNGHGVFFSIRRGARRKDFTMVENGVDSLPANVSEMTVAEINVPNSPRWLGSAMDELPVTEVLCRAQGSRRVIVAFFDLDGSRVG
jgi:hypothetical protein